MIIMQTIKSLALATLLALSIQASADTGVFVNDVELTGAQVEQLAQAYARTIQPGHYWYDRATGAWGMKCGPGLGLGAAGLDLGGEMKADASCGNTQVFFNGRELHQIDLMGLQSLSGYIAPGRYWMDAQFNAGREGGPALVNYRMLLTQKQRAGSGGDNAWSSRYGAGNSSADGSQGYVNVPGHGPVGYGY